MYADLLFYSRYGNVLSIQLLTRLDRSKANYDVKDHSDEEVVEERVGNRSRSAKGAVEEDIVDQRVVNRFRSAKGAVEEDADETESIVVEEEPDGALLEKMRRNMRSHDEGDYSFGNNVNIVNIVLRGLIT